MRRIAGFVLLLLAALIISTGVSVAGDSGKDLSGYVIMPVGGEFLIDLDATNGVAVGDLFNVVQPGEKIIHPVTNEVIGTLDETKGVLKVTRIKSGYSYAVPVGEAHGVVRGDAIRRADSQPVLAEKPTAAAPVVESDLEARLRALEERQARIVPPGREGGPAPVESSAPYRLDTVPSLGGGPVKYGAVFGGFKNVGNLSHVASMADFLKLEGRLLMASTDGKEVQVYAVGEDLTLLAQGDTGYVADIHTVQWWMPSAGGVPHLAITTWNGSEMESALFSFSGDKLTMVNEHIRYILGAFDRDGDGSPESLLGQSFDQDTFFGTQVSLLSLEGTSLQATNLDFELPSRFTVQGSLLVDITGDGRAETVFIRDNLLYIYSGQNRLYKSPKVIGGTLSVATFNTNAVNPREPMNAYASFEVRPVAADLDGDGRVELVMVASDRNPLSAPGIGTGVQRSWLAVFKYREGMFVKGALGDELDIPLQGLTMEKDRVLFVASEPESFIGGGGASHLLSFSLAK